MSIPKFSVVRSVTISMFILILVVLGIISISRMGLELMPEIEFPMMIVYAQYEATSPEDIENLITKPLEEVIATVKNVKNIKSISIEGISGLMVEFEWGTDLDDAAEEIRNKIELMKNFFPSDMQSPVILKFDPSMIPVAMLSITSDKRSYLSLHEIGTKIVKPALEQVDGVASCIIYGGDEREIIVSLDREKMYFYGINLNHVAQRLRLENINYPGGYLKEYGREYVLRTVGEFKSLDDIKNIIVSYKNYVPIYLKDIAEVKESIKETRAKTRTNKKEAIWFAVYKESGANTVIVSNGVEKAIKKFSKLLPEDIKFYQVFVMGEYIKKILSATGSNALTGGVLAIAILLIFLRNFRPTIAIAISIPISIITIFIPLYFFGFSLNFITLIGIGLAVGMLVDNSIVVIENIFRHLTEGKDRKESAVYGTEEVGLAITASTLTTIAVFVPLLFAKGITGRIFRDLALTVSFGLLSSLVVAITIVPMIASKIFKVQEVKEFKGITFLKNYYRKVIIWVLNNQKKTIVTVSVIVVLTLVLGGIFLPKQFFPEIDPNIIRGMIKLPVGYSLEQTDNIVRKIEDIVLADEDVVNISIIAGVMEGGGGAEAVMGTSASGPNEAEIIIRLKDKKERKKTAEKTAEIIRQKLPKLKNVEVTLNTAGGMMLGLEQKPISIKLYGEDIYTLEQLVNTVMTKIKNIEDIHDVESTFSRGRPEFQVKIYREKAARLGFTVSEIASVIRTAVQGSVITRMNYKSDTVDVKLRLQENYRRNIEDIEELPLVSMTGIKCKLKDIAKIDYGTGPVKLYRENQKRVIEITSNYGGKNLSSAVGKVKNYLNHIDFPAGYFVEFGGEYEDMVTMFRDLIFIFILAVLLVYMVMAAQFESFIQPLVIIVTVPLSIVGVILGLFLSGKTISLPSGMGIVILAGIIVNNAIVYIDYVNRLRMKGMDKIQSLVEAGVVRLRPILMTVLTTILGMLPMLLSRADGAAIRATVAASIIGGLTVGTFLTLIVLPTIYNVVDNWAVKVVRYLKKKI